jgi:AcrR family transcriptional regulator
MPRIAIASNSDKKQTGLHHTDQQNIQLNQRLQQKYQTRNLLIETALKLFAANGFANTTTAAISKAAGVSHGTVFAHFGTQEELLSAIIDEFGNRINSRLHELASERNSLRELLEAHVEGLMEFEDFYCSLVCEKGLLPVEAKNTFTIIQSTISFHISQALEREISEGSIKNLPVHMVFNAWIGLLHHYITNNDLFCPGGSVLQRYVQELINYYMSVITVSL